ncbi:hypothetical protein RSAG8_13950, partial [Rhizoctonia solani AG-8 WAC10335]
YHRSPKPAPLFRGFFGYLFRSLACGMVNTPFEQSGLVKCNNV